MACPSTSSGRGSAGGFAAGDLPWLRGVVDGLAKDGLAIAEERPAYDAGECPEVRVKLPT